MITRLLNPFAGPTVDDPEPERRLRAVERLDPLEGLPLLLRVAREDGDERVRRAAVARIDAVPELLALMESGEVAAAARERLAALVEDGLDIAALLTELEDLALLRHLLDAVAQRSHWEAVLARIDDEEVLAEIAVHHALAPVRDAAARRVRGEEALRAVERGVRERDRAVARAVRERLETLREARQTLEEADARLAELAGEARRLAASEDEPRLPERLGWLREQVAATLARGEAAVPVFAEFALPAPERDGARSDADAALDRLAARVEADAEALRRAEAEAAERAARAARQRELVDALARLAEDVETRLGTEADLVNATGALRTAVALEDGRWEEAAADPAPEAALADRRARLREALEADLAALERLAAAGPAPAVPEFDGTLPEGVPKAPEEAAALWARRAPLFEARSALERWLAAVAWSEGRREPAALTAVRARQGELAAVEAGIEERLERLRRRFTKLGARLEKAIDARNLKPAGGMLAELRRMAALLPEDDATASARVDTLAGGLEQAREAAFAATEAEREALCAAAERLAATEPEEPGARAADVKGLREAWNALGPGRGERGKALQARFDAAAEAAFAPSRAHFEAEAARRAEHTAARRRIVEALERFLAEQDWEAPDWKAVERTYRRAGTDWRAHEDVDADGRRLGKRYFAATRALRERLEPRWKENVARKEAIVAEARSLADPSVPAPQAASRAKGLQQAWKDVDVVPRSVDRKLWSEFRAACDAVFARLGELREAEQDARAGAIARVEALTRNVTEGTAAAVDREALAALPLRELEEALSALEGQRGPKPSKQEKDVVRVARDALGGARKARRTVGERERLAAVLAALELDGRLARAEADGAPPEADDGSLAERFRSARAARGEAAADDDARRAACVDVELALGVESPAEDTRLRLERQVARLSSGLREGKREEDPVGRVEEAVAALLAVPAASGDGVAASRRALDAVRTRLAP
ncbi:MAG: DUF349 domain-containing protein [Pseudomonadales bacterium]|jgi:hypothetical protein|nr:DUF349 domain-containing protein [Pseudomonadales bacterium]